MGRGQRRRPGHRHIVGGGAESVGQLHVPGGGLEQDRALGALRALGRVLDAPRRALQEPRPRRGRGHQPQQHGHLLVGEWTTEHTQITVLK